MVALAEKAMVASVMFLVFLILFSPKKIKISDEFKSL